MRLARAPRFRRAKALGASLRWLALAVAVSLVAVIIISVTEVSGQEPGIFFLVTSLFVSASFYLISAYYLVASFGIVSPIIDQKGTISIYNPLLGRYKKRDIVNVGYLGNWIVVNRSSGRAEHLRNLTDISNSELSDYIASKLRNNC